MTVKEVIYGVWRTDDPNPSFFMKNEIHRTSIGYMNMIIIRQNYCNYIGEYYCYRKRKWVKRTVWSALPKQKPPTLQCKIKEKLNQKRNLNVKLLNCEISINVNS